MPPHGDDCTGHSHDSEFGDEAALTSLRELIDLPRVTCLNEEAEGTGRAVLRSHGDRYVTEPRLRSTEDPDDEPELILHVPFTEAVAVRTISIEGAPPASSSGNGGVMYKNSPGLSPYTVPIPAAPEPSAAMRPAPDRDDDDADVHASIFDSSSDVF